MLNSLFEGIFPNTVTSISMPQFILCICISLLLGLFFTYVYSYKSQMTQSFALTLALLPAIVCVVIMMVNGNVGTGVAVAGAFSLVRFRSVPGNAKDISMIFLAMGAGLVIGMGYIGYGILFSLLLGLALMLFTKMNLGKRHADNMAKTLRITIPEDLNYDKIFDDLMNTYTKRYDLVSVKTTNMGSMFKLIYSIELKDSALEKEFIDALRCRNGNLEISITRQEVTNNEL